MKLLSHMRSATWLFGVVLVVVGIVVGYWLGGGPPQQTNSETVSGKVQHWTCSMHPQIDKPGPGKCPICGMALILRKDTDTTGPNARLLSVSEEVKSLMQVETAAVERRFVPKEIELVGKVAYDETKVGDISAWVPGRLDRLFVDFTGIHVDKGDHMVELYSPEVLTAQEELRRAAQSAANLSNSASESLRRTATATLEAARRKLALWGLTKEQIAQAERGGAFSDTVTIYAPMGGTVVQRSGQQGMYVKTGSHIYTIADLSEVWVMLDAYESDLPWLRFGQKVTFKADALPDKAFEGTLAFFDPMLNDMTRTVQVRVNVPNPDELLKPGMLVRGTVYADVAQSGKVAEPAMAAKYICPMHPEVQSDKPGHCTECGMPLQSVDELGYKTVENPEPPLVIPASAALITGKRAVVYVELPGGDKPTYEGREVVLGPRAGNFYIVEEGLSEGDIVVTRGNFKIDSALQILAKPSMMNPEEDNTPVPMHSGEKSDDAETETAMAPATAMTQAVETPESFKKALRVVFDDYLDVQDALANDDVAASSAAAKTFAATVVDTSGEALSEQARKHWQELSDKLTASAQNITNASALPAQRAAFESMASVLEHCIDMFGIADGAPVYVVHCPMAFDSKGADWLQNVKEVRNPYFGAAMLSCGSVKKTLVEGAVEGPAHE